MQERLSIASSAFVHSQCSERRIDPRMRRWAAFGSQHIRHSPRRGRQVSNTGSRISTDEIDDENNNRRIHACMQHSHCQNFTVPSPEINVLL